MTVIDRQSVPVSADMSKEVAQATFATNTALIRLTTDLNMKVATKEGTETLTNKTLTAPTIATPSVTGALTGDASIKAHSGTAIPAGGTAGAGILFSSATNYGFFFGSGAPSLSAAKGSLYLRSDGSGTNNRIYVNTNGSTTWTAMLTVA